MAGVKMNSRAEQFATQLAALPMTSVNGDYSKTTESSSDSGQANLPGYTAAELSDVVPTELGLTPADIADGIVVYKWAHEVTGQESWPAGTQNPTPGTGSYQMTTTEDYGVIENIGGTLKIVAKFSKRVVPTQSN
ncbi:MAG: hypothetical protein NC236_02435 [Mycoplasma sp.]|nr:hypothetical protein [Mycoplasma sp.]